MATYKVLQDIEAEDKFVGPLTLKQFILAAVCAVSIYVGFLLLAKNAWFLALPLLPVIIVTGFLAFPWGRDQPTEVWLLAKIRFMFKPRKRIWDQTGMQELVRITAPKKVEEQVSDGLSQTEVKSRLKALADTIDTRGWATKGVDGSVMPQMGFMNSSDRLVQASSLPATTSSIAVDIPASSDIFSSPQADSIAAQISSSGQQYRDTLVATMQQGGQQSTQAPPADFWFMNQPDSSTVAPGMTTFGIAPTTSTAPEPVLPPGLQKPAAPDPLDSQILSELHAKKQRSRDAFHNHKNLSPYSSNQASQTVTAAPDPATIELARNNDRSVESIARETNRRHPQIDDDEVIVSLH